MANPVVQSVEADALAESDALAAALIESDALAEAGKSRKKKKTSGKKITGGKKKASLTHCESFGLSELRTEGSENFSGSDSLLAGRFAAVGKELQLRLTDADFQLQECLRVSAVRSSDVLAKRCAVADARLRSLSDQMAVDAAASAEEDAARASSLAQHFQTADLRTQQCFESADVSVRKRMETSADLCTDLVRLKSESLQRHLANAAARDTTAAELSEMGVGKKKAGKKKAGARDPLDVEGPPAGQGPKAARRASKGPKTAGKASAKASKSAQGSRAGVAESSLEASTSAGHAPRTSKSAGSSRRPSGSAGLQQEETSTPGLLAPTSAEQSSPPRRSKAASGAAKASAKSLSKRTSSKASPAAALPSA